MKKIPLILLPGLLCDASVWAHQKSHLNAIANIIIPNLGKAKTPSEMISAVLDIAPATFALAGHSMGGWVALEVAKQVPNRIQRLCLINTTANLDTKEKAAARQNLIALAAQGQHDIIINNLMKLFVYKQEYANIIRTMLNRNKSSLINQEMAMLQREDCMASLSSITCPTMIIHSSHDAIFNIEDSEILHKNIINSTIFTIQQAGHMSPIEAADEVTELMRKWLT